MICRKCNTELPDNAKFCLECGEPQNTEAMSKQVKWEVCEIVCTQLPTNAKGNRDWEFRAEASGPNGKYLAAAPYVSTVNPDAPGDTLSKDKSNYIRYVHSSLVRTLVQDGWEPLELLGSRWYSYRFRRRVGSPSAVRNGQ